MAGMGQRRFRRAGASTARLRLNQMSCERVADGSLAISDRLARAGIPAADRGRIFAPTAFATTPSDPTSARRDQQQFIPSYVLATVFVSLPLVVREVMPVLEAGRVLVTVALVTKVVATKELE